MVRAKHAELQGGFKGVDPCRSDVDFRRSAEGVKGVAREGGTGRRNAVMAEALGGKLESFYFAFRDVDAYVVVDLPDHVSASAAALAVNQAGGAVDYRAPGR